MSTDVGKSATKKGRKDDNKDKSKEKKDEEKRKSNLKKRGTISSSSAKKENEKKKGVESTRKGQAKDDFEARASKDAPKKGQRNRREDRKTIAGMQPLSSTNEEDFKQFEENFVRNRGSKKSDKKKGEDKKGEDKKGEDKKGDDKKGDDKKGEDKKGDDKKKKTEKKKNDTDSDDKKSSLNQKGAIQKKSDSSDGENDRALIDEDIPDEKLSSAAITAVLGDLEAEFVTEEFLDDLSEVLRSDEDFRRRFLAQEGFNKLSIHLVKSKSTTTAKILDLLSTSFDDKVVFATLFGESAVMLTTLIWLLVKARGDLLVSSKVYTVLAKLPSAAKSANFDEAPTMVLNSLDLYNYKSMEGRRFHHLMQALSHGHTPELKIAILKLINSLTGMYDDVDTRIGLRTEFISLGLLDVLETLEKYDNPDIKREINIFRDSRFADEEEFSRAHDIGKERDLKSLSNLLIKQLENKKAAHVATDVFSNLLRLHTDDMVGVPKWLLVSKLVTQIAKGGETITDNRDFVRLNDLLQSLQNTELNMKKEIDEAHNHLQKANLEIMSLKEELSKKKGEDTGGSPFEFAKLREEISSVRNAHQSIEDDRIRLSRELAEAKSQLNQVNQKLAGKSSLLSFTEVTLRATDARLTETKKKLYDAEQELQEIRKRLKGPQVAVSHNNNRDTKENDSSTHHQQFPSNDDLSKPQHPNPQHPNPQHPNPQHPNPQHPNPQHSNSHPQSNQNQNQSGNDNEIEHLVAREEARLARAFGKGSGSSVGTIKVEESKNDNLQSNNDNSQLSWVPPQSKGASVPVPHASENLTQHSTAPPSTTSQPSTRAQSTSSPSSPSTPNKQSSGMTEDDMRSIKEEQRLLRAVSKYSGGRLGPETKTLVPNVSSTNTEEREDITSSVESESQSSNNTQPKQNPAPTFIKLPTKKRKGKGALQAKLAAMYARTEQPTPPIDHDASRSEQEKFNLASEYIKQSNLEGFKAIVSRMKDINLKGEADEDQNTLLHWAAACGQAEMAKLLLEMGATQITNAYDETPYDLAHSGVDDGLEGYQSIVDLLKT